MEKGKKKIRRNKALPEGKGPGEKDQAIFFFLFSLCSEARHLKGQLPAYLHFYLPVGKLGSFPF